MTLIWRSFMQHSHPFMPVLDPAYDTWDAYVS